MIVDQAKERSRSANTTTQHMLAFWLYCIM